jgi:LPXTG-motif cell wall-anchored protein
MDHYSITVAELSIIDAVDHHRAIRDEYDDLSHPDVIAAYDDRVRAADAWQYAYHHAAPSVWIEYIARTDPANARPSRRLADTGEDWLALAAALGAGAVVLGGWLVWVRRSERGGRYRR